MYGNYNNGPGGYPYQNSSPYYGGTPSYSSPSYQAPQPQQTQMMNTNKLYANGIEDVRCRQLPSNSDYIFLDNDKPLIYRKTTDSTEKMSVEVFKIVPYEEESSSKVNMSDYVLKTDFEELRAEISQLKDSFKAKSSSKKESL